MSSMARFKQTLIRRSIIPVRNRLWYTLLYKEDMIGGKA